MRQAPLIYVLLIGFCYGIVIGTLIATKVLGW